MAVIQPDPGNDRRVAASVAVAADFGCVECSKSLLQFFRRLGLLLPDTVFVLDICCPPDQIWSYSMRRSTGNAFAVHNAQISWCGLRMGLEPSLGFHGSPVLSVPNEHPSRINRSNRSCTPSATFGRFLHISGELYI